MTTCEFHLGDQTRKPAAPVARAVLAGHHERMELVVQVDRSLRVAVSDRLGNQVAALRLTRGGAESLADALLEFSGNQARGLAARSSVTLGASDDGPPTQRGAA